MSTEVNPFEITPEEINPFDIPEQEQEKEEMDTDTALNTLLKYGDVTISKRDKQ